jgi:hypothetical protein
MASYGYLLRKPKFIYNRSNIYCKFIRRLEDVLLLPATLYYHKSAIFDCGGIRLLGSPRGYKYCSKLSQYYVVRTMHFFFALWPTVRLFIIIIIIIIIVIYVMELGHLLTRSGLTYPKVSSKICHDFFCQLGNKVSLPWVIYYEAFYLHVVSSFSCIPVICLKLMLFLISLQFMYLFFNQSKCIRFFMCSKTFNIFLRVFKINA